MNCPAIGTHHVEDLNTAKRRPREGTDDALNPPPRPLRERRTVGSAHASTRLVGRAAVPTMSTAPQLRAPLLLSGGEARPVGGFTVDLPAGASVPLSPEETQRIAHFRRPDENGEDPMGRVTLDLDARLHEMAQSGARSSFNPAKVGASEMESWVESPRPGPDGQLLHRQPSLADRGHRQDSSGNIFVGPGALVVGRGGCCGGFSDLPWFPTCTSPDEESTEDEPHAPGWREKIYTITSGRWRYRSDWSKLGWICWWLNVLAVIGIAVIVVVGTMPCADMPHWLKQDGGSPEDKERRANGSMRVHDEGCSAPYFATEWVCMVYFTLEFTARASTATAATRRTFEDGSVLASKAATGSTRAMYEYCGCRCRAMKWPTGWFWKWSNLLDLFVIVTFFLAEALEAALDAGSDMDTIVSALFIARMVLVVRVLRVGDLYKASYIFVDGMRRSKKAIFVLLNVGFILMVSSGCLLYVFEGSRSKTRLPCDGPGLTWVPGCRFQSIPQTFWFSVSLLGLQGVGDDAIPQTLLGRAAGVALMVTGTVLLSFTILVVGTQFESSFRRFRGKETKMEKVREIFRGGETCTMSLVITKVQRFDRKFADHLRTFSLQNEDEVSSHFLERALDEWEHSAGLADQAEEVPDNLALYHAVQELETKMGGIEELLEQQMDATMQITKAINSIPGVVQTGSGLSVSKRRKARMKESGQRLERFLRGSSNTNHFFFVGAKEHLRFIHTLQNQLQQHGLLAECNDRDDKDADTVAVTEEDRIDTLNQSDVIVFFASAESYADRSVQVELRAAFEVGKPIVILLQDDLRANPSDTLGSASRVIELPDGQDELPTLTQKQVEWLDSRVADKHYVRFIASEYRRLEAVSQLARLHKMVVEKGRERIEPISDDGAQKRPDDWIPDPEEREFDLFLNHAQHTGADQAKTLYLLLQAAGVKVWYDMHARNLTTQGMRQGIRNSRCILLFLSDGIMARPFCVKEQRWAKKYDLGFIGVMERDPRHGEVDLRKEKLRAPSDLECLFEHIEFLNYERRDHQAEAMVQKIIEILRSGKAPKFPPSRPERRWVELSPHPVGATRMVDDAVAVPPPNLREHAAYDDDTMEPQPEPQGATDLR